MFKKKLANKETIYAKIVLSVHLFSYVINCMKFTCT